MQLTAFRIGEPIMQNYHALETEAAHRRWEWEKRIVAAEQSALALPKNGLERWPHLPLLVLACLRTLFAHPDIPGTSVWNAVTGGSTKTPAGGRAPGT